MNSRLLMPSSALGVMSAKHYSKDYLLDDLPQIRDAFTTCIKDLIVKSDFDVMYEELNNTPICLSVKNECRVSLY